MRAPTQRCKEFIPAKAVFGINPLFDRSKGPVCYSRIPPTSHRGRGNGYLCLCEGGSLLNAHARHFVVGRQSNLRGSETKSDPRAQRDEWHHVS